MLPNERRQIRYDFGLAPDLIETYLPDDEQEDALKMVRHVNVVTTYLAWMAVGESRHYEGVLYAAALGGMDAVTDHRQSHLADGTTLAALEGQAPHEELELVTLASEAARSDDFDFALQQVAAWQDHSLEQFDSPNKSRLVDITKKKGGYSAMAHLYAIKDDVTHPEERFMLEFGETMQWLDDYLDQPQDREAGISTLFTEGYVNREDLVRKRNRMMDRAEGLWGRSAATRRFRRILKLHTRLGDIANRFDTDPARFVPYYM